MTKEASGLSSRYSYEFIEGRDSGSDHYRVRDATDGRIATCYLEAHAQAVVSALNAVRSERPRSEWLVWSNEHRAWWGPNKAGYPKDVRLAGRYTLDEARAICDQRSWDDLNVPPETMIHEAEAGFMQESNERKGEE